MTIRPATEKDIDRFKLSQKDLYLLHIQRLARTRRFSDHVVEKMQRFGFTGLDKAHLKNPAIFVAEDHTTVPGILGGNEDVFLIIEPGIQVRSDIYNILPGGKRHDVYKNLRPIWLDDSVIKKGNLLVKKDLLNTLAKNTEPLDIVADAKDIDAMISLILHHENDLFNSDMVMFSTISQQIISQHTVDEVESFIKSLSETVRQGKKDPFDYSYVSQRRLEIAGGVAQALKPQLRHAKLNLKMQDMFNGYVRRRKVGRQRPLRASKP